VFALGAAAIWIEILKPQGGAGLGVGGLLLGDLYVIAGLSTIAVAGLIDLCRATPARRLAGTLHFAPAVRFARQGHPVVALRAIPSGNSASVDRQSTQP
jgi:hypothetical protein